MQLDDDIPLAAFLSDERRDRLEHVLAQRTRNLTLVLEDLYDPHNAAACLRSAEAFGIQDVHVVTGEHSFDPSRRVVQGADKWLHVHRYPDTRSCLAALEAAGYTVWASDLGEPETTRTIDAIDFDGRIALAFGNEHAGASRALVEGAHGRFVIPMRGFTQSFNVSVAVALSLYHAVSRRRTLHGDSGDLPPAEQDALRREWVQLAVKRGDRIGAALRRESGGEATEEA